MAQRLKLNHQSVHLTALKTYLVHYCHEFDWQPRALGAVRARNWGLLIELANELDETLQCNGTWSGKSPTEVWVPYDADKFYLVGQFVAMLTKYPFDQEQMPGLDPDAVAIEKLLKDERRNRRINSVLRAYRVRGLDRHPSHEIMRQWILKVMGERPDFRYIYEHCDFSNGASIGVHGKATHFGNKVGKQLSCTPSALKYFTAAVQHHEQLHHFYSCEARAKQGANVTLGSAISLLTPGELRDYFEGSVKLVQEDLLSCAPKKYDCSRTVGTPQTCNTFIQKGADLLMRRNLKDRANLDLSRQDVNQEMAREGALPGYRVIPYVTLDVRGASNSVLTEVVRTCYSREWFSFLDDIRSPGYKLPDGKTGRYELFVSMGNGYCFPLETSIFAAACVAASKMAGVPCDFRVYGDDIIVRQDIALLLCEILRSLGFRLNLSKSFIHGPFRESCGANWHGEQDVTPAYWRHRITTRSELHAIHNAHYRFPKIQEALRSFETEKLCTVPDTAQYAFVTDQAFRVGHDMCMGNGAVWRRDTQSFRYRMLQTEPVPDEAIPAEDRWIRLRHISALRGSTFEDAFLLRRSTYVHYLKPNATSPECNFSGKKKQLELREAWKVPSEPAKPRTTLWVEAALRGCFEHAPYGRRVPRERPDCVTGRWTVTRGIFRINKT